MVGATSVLFSLCPIMESIETVGDVLEANLCVVYLWTTFHLSFDTPGRDAWCVKRVSLLGNGRVTVEFRC